MAAKEIAVKKYIVRLSGGELRKKRDAWIINPRQGAGLNCAEEPTLALGFLSNAFPKQATRSQ